MENMQKGMNYKFKNQKNSTPQPINPSKKKSFEFGNIINAIIVYIEFIMFIKMIAMYVIIVRDAGIAHVTFAMIGNLCNMNISYNDDIHLHRTNRHDKNSILLKCCDNCIYYNDWSTLFSIIH